MKMMETAAANIIRKGIAVLLSAHRLHLNRATERLKVVQVIIARAMVDSTTCYLRRISKANRSPGTTRPVGCAAKKAMCYIVEQDQRLTRFKGKAAHD
jgi:hypothetical protein